MVELEKEIATKPSSRMSILKINLANIVFDNKLVLRYIAVAQMQNYRPKAIRKYSLVLDMPQTKNYKQLNINPI